MTGTLKSTPWAPKGAGNWTIYYTYVFCCSSVTNFQDWIGRTSSAKRCFVTVASTHIFVASAFEDTTFLLVRLLITWPVKSAKSVGGGRSVSMHWNLKKKNHPQDVKEKMSALLLVKLLITWPVHSATAGGAGKEQLVKGQCQWQSWVGNNKKRLLTIERKKFYLHTVQNAVTVRVTLRLADSQPVCLGVEPHLGSWPDSLCFSLTVSVLMLWCPPLHGGASGHCPESQSLCLC